MAATRLKKQIRKGYFFLREDNLFSFILRFEKNKRINGKWEMVLRTYIRKEKLKRLEMVFVSKLF